MSAHGAPRVRTAVPGLIGQGVLLAAPRDADRIREALTQAGYAVAQADLQGHLSRTDPLSTDDPPLRPLRRAQVAIATALHLPSSAAGNLDAMVDSLRDLATWWPDDERVALLLHGAESLVEADLPGWQTLTEILREASRDLWRGGEVGDRAFETIALVDRHGVPALPEGGS